MGWLLFLAGLWIYLSIVHYNYHAALAVSVKQKPKEHSHWWTPIAQWFFSSILVGWGVVLIFEVQTFFAASWTIYFFMVFNYVSANIFSNIFTRMLNSR